VPHGTATPDFARLRLRFGGLHPGYELTTIYERTDINGKRTLR
jgi:hypothetical protein